MIFNQKIGITQMTVAIILALFQTLSNTDTPQNNIPINHHPPYSYFVTTICRGPDKGSFALKIA